MGYIRNESKTFESNFPGSFRQQELVHWYGPLLRPCVQGSIAGLVGAYAMAVTSYSSQRWQEDSVQQQWDTNNTKSAWGEQVEKPGSHIYWYPQ